MKISIDITSKENYETIYAWLKPYGYDWFSPSDDKYETNRLGERYLNVPTISGNKNLLVHSGPSDLHDTVMTDTEFIAKHIETESKELTLSNAFSVYITEPEHFQPILDFLIAEGFTKHCSTTCDFGREITVNSTYSGRFDKQYEIYLGKPLLCRETVTSTEFMEKFMTTIHPQPQLTLENITLEDSFCIDMGEPVETQVVYSEAVVDGFNTVVDGLNTTINSKIEEITEVSRQLRDSAAKLSDISVQLTSAQSKNREKDNIIDQLKQQIRTLDSVKLHANCEIERQKEMVDDLRNKVTTKNNEGLKQLSLAIERQTTIERLNKQLDEKQSELEIAQQSVWKKMSKSLLG